MSESKDSCKCSDSSCNCTGAVYCQCEIPARKTPAPVCSVCNKPIQMPEKAVVFRRRVMKEYLAKYDEKNLRFMYFRIREVPGIIVTAVSILNKERNSLKVAFSFCSPKDGFCKADGKINCFERLEDPGLGFCVEVPWLDDGLLTVCYAFNKIEKPEKISYVKFDSLILKNPGQTITIKL